MPYIVKPIEESNPLIYGCKIEFGSNLGFLSLSNVCRTPIIKLKIPPNQLINMLSKKYSTIKVYVFCCRFRIQSIKISKSPKDIFFLSPAINCSTTINYRIHDYCLVVFYGISNQFHFDTCCHFVYDKFQAN